MCYIQDTDLMQSQQSSIEINLTSRSPVNKAWKVFEPSFWPFASGLECVASNSSWVRSRRYVVICTIEKLVRYLNPLHIALFLSCKPRYPWNRSRDPWWFSQDYVFEIGIWNEFVGKLSRKVKVHMTVQHKQRRWLTLTLTLTMDSAWLLLPHNVS